MYLLSNTVESNIFRKWKKNEFSRLLLYIYFCTDNRGLHLYSASLTFIWAPLREELWVQPSVTSPHSNFLAKTHLEVKGHTHSFSPSSASPLSGLKPRPMAPISECGRPADRLVNIHEKATSLMIPTCSERWRGCRKWPLTGHGETCRAWTSFSATYSKRWYMF